MGKIGSEATGPSTVAQELQSLMGEMVITRPPVPVEPGHPVADEPMQSGVLPTMSQERTVNTKSHFFIGDTPERQPDYGEPMPQVNLQKMC